MAAFGDTGISMGNGNTDSYNSGVGPYATSKCTTVSNCVGGVATNATTSGGINLGPNASVKGQCQIGAGAPTTFITPNSSKCNTTTVQPATVALSVPSIPVTPVPTALGAISGNYTFPATGGSFTMTSLSLSGQSALSVPSNLTAPIIVYLTGSNSVISMSGQGSVNNTTSLPTNLIFMCTSTSTTQSISLSGNGLAYFAVYCPRASITISGNGQIYGAIVGKTVNFNGNNGFIHYDQALGAATSSAISCSGTEVTRSSPVVAAITPAYGGAAQDCLVQGSFVSNTSVPTTITTGASILTHSFPYYTGHMRATLASKVTTTASTLTGTLCTGSNTPAGCSVLFNAGTAGKIPAPNAPSTTACASVAGTCRYVFTNTNTVPANGVTFRPTTTVIAGSTNVGNLVGPRVTSGLPGPFTAVQYQALMTKILVAPLGGVDRSTVAVIPPSSLAGSGTRATMAYFGSTDGMIHAVCASRTGACSSLGLGTELWAFLPRVQLPLIATNKTRIDGSVRVVDAFGDFVNNPATGTKSWRTVLTFQTGYAGTSKPAVYALDVTDPANPALLWEHTQPTTLGSVALGVGLTVGAGQTLVGGALNNVVVVQASNGGTGGAGVYANALSLETGAANWSAPFSYLFSTSPRYIAGDQVALARGIPGGAVPVDLGGQGFITDFVMGDIFGNFWRLNAADGTSRNGTATPLFAFSTNYHPIGAPPAIYSNGSQQFAAFASGGYADPTAATYSTSNQYLIAVKLASTAATVNESTSACATCALTLNAALIGSKAFSQVLIVGSQLFVTSSNTGADVNASTYGAATTNTGTQTVANLSTLAVTSTTAIFAGGSSLASKGTNLYSSSSQKQQKMISATSAVGPSVEVTGVPKMFRNLWLRSE